MFVKSKDALVVTVLCARYVSITVLGPGCKRPFASARSNQPKTCRSLKSQKYLVYDFAIRHFHWAGSMNIQHASAVIASFRSLSSTTSQLGATPSMFRGVL